MASSNNEAANPKVGTSLSDKQQNTEEDAPASKEASFEDAVIATGYGKFHYLLYLAIVPASWASGFDTSTTSMIAPSAECDLNITLFQKGVLNAVVYAGMVCSALMWGFMADAFGRKPIVYYGYLADSILNILSGLSQSFYVLSSFKFLTGFIVSGPYASVMTYCAEFHCTKDRPRITMFVGFLITAGSIVGAVLALWIIPQDWSFKYGNFSIHSWQIYLSFSGVPVLIGTLFLGFFPESPKFLMSQGRNEEALKVFQKIYAKNSGKSPKDYPIKLLENEVTNEPSKESNDVIIRPKSLKTCAYEGMLQLKPLFSGSYLPRLLLVVSIQFCGMLSTNTIRLWQPQLFAMLASEAEEVDSDSDFSFCDIIDQSTLSKINETIASVSNVAEKICIRKKVDNSVYTNTIIISAASLFFTFLATALVSYIRNKHLLLACYFVAACSIIALNWSKNTVLTLILISLFVGCLSASVNLVLSVVVNLFPTTMRTMAVSLTMMFGRIGSLIGNVLFPVFLGFGCSIALVVITILVIAAFIMTVFIPKPKETVR